MKPKQCPHCLNQIFCQTCATKMKGKCGYCNKTGVTFIPINHILMKLIKSFRFKCVNHEKGCSTILSGEDFEIYKHETTECEHRDEQDIVKPTGKNCYKCSSSIDLSKKTHLCDKEQEAIFCTYHRSKDAYVFSEDRIVGYQRKSKEFEDILEEEEKEILKKEEPSEQETANFKIF